MFKDFVKQEMGVELYPLISLCIFVLFFTLLLIRVWAYSKSQLKELSSIPLQDSLSATEETTANNNKTA